MYRFFLDIEFLDIIYDFFSKRIKESSVGGVKYMSRTIQTTEEKKIQNPPPTMSTEYPSEETHYLFWSESAAEECGYNKFYLEGKELKYTSIFPDIDGYSKSSIYSNDQCFLGCITETEFMKHNVTCHMFNKSNQMPNFIDISGDLGVLASMEGPCRDAVDSP